MFPIDSDLNLFAKDQSVVADWNNRKLHPRARNIAIVLAQYLYLKGYPCVITSIHDGRDDTGSKLYSGVHAAWRAIDARCNTMQRHEAEDIRKDINRRFVYGLRSSGNPGETITPLDHGTAPHFHIQVPAGR